MKRTPKTTTASGLDKLELRLTRKLVERDRQRSRKVRRTEKTIVFALAYDR